MATDSPRATSLYPPSPGPGYTSQSELSFYKPPSDIPSIDPKVLRSLSPENLQKMKYKIELDKQVNEKQQRITREWEKKIERDRKYVQHQAFGRHDRATFLKKEELQEILQKGRAPSPSLEMPQQYTLHQQQQQQPPPFMGGPYPPNDDGGSNMYNSPRQPPYNNYSQYPNYPPGPTQSQQQPQSPKSSQNRSSDFTRSYGSNGNSNPNLPAQPVSTSTTQLIKGDAHDPFLLYDPNKEGQNVFNAIPQQDLYDPWGRPGGGAPLIHPPTGQKFTRYSGSLQEKLNNVGPLGFNRRQYSEDIEEQKHELEVEQKRRQQQEMEHRSNAGDTAEWITQLERSRYPLKLHLPTTETTREISGARTRYRSEESLTLHNDLVRQAEERSRLQKLSRYQDNAAELQHTEAMNSWWGRNGGGAPTFTNRRHNVHNTFEGGRQKWTKNHLGQLVLSEDENPTQLKLQATDYFYPKSRQLSNHRNFYQVSEDKA